MHSYLHHTILMFNPTNIDEVSIQVTHIEAKKGKHDVEYMSKEPHEFEEQQKGKWKNKKTNTVNKDEENQPTCSHCEKKGHDENNFWKLHLELKLKWAHPRKGKKKKAMTIVQDLGSDFEDETKVATMSIKGKSYVASFSLCISYTKSKVILDGI